MKKLFLLCLFVIPLDLFATTQLQYLEISPQQITIHTFTTATGACTFAINEGTTTSATQVNDVNTTFFPGSNSDARSGSTVQGTSRTFVAGTRTAEVAAGGTKQGLVTSRSLQALTPYFLVETCGGDVLTIGVVVTANPPVGNSWGEPVPYLNDANFPDGYAYPSVSLTDKTGANSLAIDPRTGYLIKKITALDQAADPGGPVNPTSLAVTEGGFNVVGTSWTTPTKGAIVDGVFATSTNNDPLYIALAPIPVCGSLFRTASWDNSVQSCTNSGVQVEITGNGTGGANNADICMGVSGVGCITAKKTITIPGATGAVDYPTPAGKASITEFWADWLDTTTTQAPSTFDLATFTGTVDVATTTVTLTAGNHFNTQKWVAGSHILIASGVCTPGDYLISSITSDTVLVLASSPGNCTGATYTGYNAGLLVFPKGAAVLNIDGVKYTFTERPNMVNPDSGDFNYFNQTEVTDASGNVGLLGFIANGAGAASMYFLPVRPSIFTAGQSTRMLTSQWLPGGNYGSTGADVTLFGQFGSLNNGLINKVSNPNVFYAIANNGSNKKSIIEITYTNGNYVNYAPTDQNQTADLAYVNKTPASSGAGTLTDRLVAFDPAFDINYYTNYNIVSVRDNYLTIDVNTLQDAMAWVINIDLTTFAVKSMWWSGNLWSGIHSITDNGNGTTITYSTQSLFTSSLSGFGPYQLDVVAVGGNPAAGLPNAAGAACAGVVDPKVTGLIAFGQGCVDITMPGTKPCRANTSAYEAANFPVCPWNGAYRQLYNGPASGQSWRVGDMILDNGTLGKSGGEQMLIVVDLGGNIARVLRNYASPKGPFLNDPKTESSTLQAHAANFIATMAPGIWGADCEIYGDFSTDIHGTNLLCDFAYYYSSHGDKIKDATIGVRTFTGVTQLEYSVRSYPGQPFLSQVGLQQNIGTTSPFPSTSTGFNFNGVLGSNIYDDHPSYRQFTAPASEQNYIVGSTKIGIFTSLYSGATITPVTGTLYKLDGYELQASVNPKARPLFMWGGRHNAKDVSGGTLGGTSADYYNYCQPIRNNDCVAGSVANELYFNSPSLNRSGDCTLQAYAIYPCASPITGNIGAVSQIGFNSAFPNSTGSLARTIAKAFQPWSIGSAFTSSVAIPNGMGVIFPMEFANSIRTDLYAAKLPPFPPLDTVNRLNYVNLNIQVAGLVSDQVRIAFGYKEFSSTTPTDYFCVTRREICYTSSTATLSNPFVYSSETQHYFACGALCTATIPVIPGHTVYYQVHHLRAGFEFVDPPQVATVN